MRITGLKTFVANVSRTNFVFVKLYADDGIDGVGEATLEWRTLAILTALQEVERQLVGRDPFQSDAVVEQLYRDGYWRDFPWRKELVKEALVFEDGYLLVPTAPGLGVELDEEACARRPYEPHDVPLFDGSINLSGVATGAVVMNGSRS